MFSSLSVGSGKTRRLLDSYADDRFPYAAAPGALTPDQRRENLSAFVATIDRRIARLQAFAGELGTRLPIPTGDRAQVEAISQALDRFCKSELSIRSKSLWRPNYFHFLSDLADRRYR